MKFSESYRRWLESQAKSPGDFLLLGLGPLFLTGLLLWMLPARWGRLGAFILAGPALYVTLVVLGGYARRYGRK